jgi:DNA repair exonuclease SbcCD ATPase subunit
MLKDYRKKVNRDLARWTAAKERCLIERKALEDVQERLADLEEAQGIAQLVAQQIQSQAHNQIADIVSKCLEAVFDEPYQFVIQFERKRGRTEAKLFFKRGDVEVDPLTASGGGVVDVASLALRVACLSLSRPPVRKVLILDEPFKMLSMGLRSRVRVLLEGLAEDMGIQIVMVTHDPQLRAGKVVRLGL